METDTTKIKPQLLLSTTFHFAINTRHTGVCLLSKKRYLQLKRRSNTKDPLDLQTVSLQCTVTQAYFKEIVSRCVRPYWSSPHLAIGVSSIELSSSWMTENFRMTEHSTCCKSGVSYARSFDWSCNLTQVAEHDLGASIYEQPIAPIYTHQSQHLQKSRRTSKHIYIIINF